MKCRRSDWLILNVRTNGAGSHVRRSQSRRPTLSPLCRRHPHTALWSLLLRQSEHNAGENLGSKSPDGNVAAAVLDSEAAEQSLVRRNQSYEHGYRIRRMG